MRNFLFGIILITFLPQVTLTQTAINEENSNVSFVFVDDDVDGTINDFKFTGNIDHENFLNSSLKGSVAMETLDTDNWFRDRHLRSRKYFNNKEYPRMFFESKRISIDGSTYLVIGDLTIKGISKEITFEFQNSSSTLTGKTTINTSDFNINIHKESSRNEVQIFITMAYE